MRWKARRRPAEATPAATVAVVLGAALRPDGSPTPALARRVARGVGLLNEGRVAALVLSGGGRHPAVSEAAAMAALAHALGAPTDALHLETASANTRENARHALALLAGWARPPARLVVVSDGWHLPRAWLCFAVAARRRPAIGSGGAAPPPALSLVAAPARPAAAVWWLGLLREGPALAADLVRVWRS